MILEKAILKLYPDAVPNKDFLVVDDGNGPEIRNWKRKEPIPTLDQLQNVWTTYNLGTVTEEPSELDQIKKNQELMQAALDGLLLGGGL
jgi:hypothetical protein